MATADPIAHVLNAAADHLDQMEDWRAAKRLRNGAGGEIFVLLYETAKRLYGTTAIEVLERYLRGQLPHGQIQHWSETDRHEVAKKLRLAASAPTPPERQP